MITPASHKTETDGTAAHRRIAHRTQGRSHGPLTRLMSPGDQALVRGERGIDVIGKTPRVLEAIRATSR